MQALTAETGHGPQEDKAISHKVEEEALNHTVEEVTTTMERRLQEASTKTQHRFPDACRGYAPQSADKTMSHGELLEEIGIDVIRLLSEHRQKPLVCYIDRHRHGKTRWHPDCGCCYTNGGKK